MGSRRTEVCHTRCWVMYVEVKEIVAGISSPEEILETMKGMEEQHAKDQAILPTRVVSMDVEELRVTHYDWMKVTGELPMTTNGSSCHVS